jgi:hypothetical protein
MIDMQLLSIQQKITSLKKKMTNPELIDEIFQNFWKETIAAIANFD